MSGVQGARMEPSAYQAGHNRKMRDVQRIRQGAEMSVYVDDVRHSFGRMIMCHLWADNEDELHTFAAELGIKRAWFQCPPKASWNHYDISLSVKAKAMRLGAILTDKYGPAMHEATRTGNQTRIDQITALRLRGTTK